MAAARKVDDKALFRIGSTGKTFTAIALMQLVEQGVIALDDDVNGHLRRFRLASPPGSGPVTIRHLVSHTGGFAELRSWADAARLYGGLGVRPRRAVPELDEYYAPTLRALSPPGLLWRYSNHGIATLRCDY